MITYMHAYARRHGEGRTRQIKDREGSALLKLAGYGSILDPFPTLNGK